MTLRSLKAGLRSLFRRRDVERDLHDELAFYLEQATREQLRAGKTPAEAERAARVEMGSLVSAREQALSGHWEARVEALLKDARYGLRAIRRNPGFAAAAILTIALGTGANTAVFSVVNAVMLRPLPWLGSDRLALIWTDDARRGLHREATAYRTITDWQAASRTFEKIAYFSSQRIAMLPHDPGGDRGRARSALVSASLFDVLGIGPAQGRVISTADETGRAPVAVISHTFWQRWFGGTPDILGKTVVVDAGAKTGLATLTVIGVMPAGFYFPDRTTEIWTPATTYWRFDTESVERFPSWARRWTAVGRLAAGVSLAEARAEFADIGRQLAATHTSTVPDFPGFETTLVSVLDSITGRELQMALWMLLGAVCLVLLVACANVANLLLARGASRQPEFALRRALGAGRGRIVAQLLTESMLLSFAGGAVGTLLAWWGTRVIAGAASDFVPRIDEAAVDGRVLGFALLSAIVAGLVFGLGPAVQLAKSGAGDVLKDGMRGTARRQVRRSRDLLVIAECTLAFVLLTGAGLLLRSLGQLYSVEPGFDPTNVLTVRLEFPTEPPPSPAEQSLGQALGPTRTRARVARANELVERIQSLPGVQSVGFSDDLFVAGQGNESITIPGRPADEMAVGELNSGSLTAGSFSALRVPLRRGRFLTDDDVEQKIVTMYSQIIKRGTLAEKEKLAPAEPVVVNEAFARRFFPNDDPVGRKFCIDPTGKTYWLVIVGVVGDMHRQGLERRVIPEFFSPWSPQPNGRADLLVRVARDPLGLSGPVRDVVKRTVPGSTVVSMSTADALLGDFTALRRLQTWLLTGFALLGLALAGIGVFALVHFAIAERTREIGIRVTLGATPASVMALVLAQGLRTPAIGIGIGLVAALGLTRVLSSQLFGITATDPITFAVAGLAFVSLAAAASWLAGRRALRIDPARALRDA